jgi:hypothetical protein
MNEQNLHTNYSAADIIRYLDGMMSVSEMHAIEKAALDDPFLADAIEGMQTARREHTDDVITGNIDQLRQQLAARAGVTTLAPVRSMRWWQVAAALLILLVSSVVLYNVLSVDEKTNEIAVVNPETSPAVEQQAAPATPQATIETAKDSSPLRATEETPVVRHGNAITESKSKTVEAPKTSGLVSTEKSDDKADRAVATTVESPGVRGGQLSPPVSPAGDLAAPKIIRNDSIVVTRTQDAEKEKLDILQNNERKAFAAQTKKGSKDKSASIPAMNNAALNYFNGRVLDSSNRPLSNASLFLLNNRNHVLTDQYGNFRFSSPDTVVDINVSIVGYDSRNIRLSNSVPINQIQLTPSNNSLNEVVVTGSGKGRDKKQSARYRTNYPSVLVQNAEPSIGWVDFDTYIANNKKDIAGADVKPGEVVVAFQVNQRGELSNFKIEQSLSPAQDAEAIRLVKEGPTWRLLKGKRTRVLVIIRF